MPILVNPSRFTVVAGSTYDAVITAKSPAGRWKLDDTSGTTAVATVGTNGTIVTTGSGGTLRPILGVTGLVTDGGTAMDTTNSSGTGGSQAYIQLPLSGLGTAGSLVWWGAHIGGGNAGIPMMRDVTGSSGWFFDISGTNPIFRVNGTSQTLSSVTASTLRTGSRHMYGFTTDGTNCAFYIDSGTAVQTWTKVANFSTINTGFRLGVNGTTTLQPYGGVWDDFAFWTSKLSATDMGDLFAAG